ncbi:MFS transporter [Nocardia caishijiensis]|uniref:MFS family arabinose efflux permease n=1 Tax=Nocardia caishijiensis TaxID=184756 RepID=A0ABQ6YMS3_9NOCA|nr:MFS transporter [Nocardia caishijiensis]KAF0847094.1 putative MFS family arabinose efflux permease [Nocardia caishijiensis]
MSTTTRPGVITAGTLALLSSLYFAQGLPFGFFTQALPVVLRESGYSLVAISASGVLFLPWALKFLWAPYVDRYGTRRTWLLVLQLCAAAVAAVLACLDLSASLRWLFVGIVVVNLLSATQDVATDGLAVRLLGSRERGLGNGIQVGAYRVGMIVGGGVLLWLFAVSGWRLLFLTMAVLILLTTVPVWLLREPVTDRLPRPKPVYLLGTWLARLRRPGILTLIVLIGAFKFGDSMASALTGPFLADAGLDLGRIALVKGVISSAGALAGAAVGGWLAFRFGRRRALLLGGVTQTASIVLYLVAALGLGGFELLVAASLTEHIFGGAATVAVFALMMDAADTEYAGSDYTLLACAVVVVQGVAGLAAGVVGDLAGYPALFGTALVLSGLGCAAMVLGLSRGLGPVGLYRSVGIRVRDRPEVPVEP